jgi:hypothetical protein
VKLSFQTILLGSFVIAFIFAVLVFSNVISDIDRFKIVRKILDSNKAWAWFVISYNISPAPFPCNIWNLSIVLGALCSVWHAAKLADFAMATPALVITSQSQSILQLFIIVAFGGI